MKTKNSRVAGIALVLVFITGVSIYLFAPQANGLLAKSHCYAGAPKPTTNKCKLKVMQNIGFIVGYCDSRKNPEWVAYKIFKIPPTKPAKRPGRFKTDMRTISKVAHKDYTHSGYDRGHLAPNYAIATRYGRKAQLETFLMSNICPQKPNLNRRIWKNLELMAAKEYANNLEEVWIVTGPIYDEDIEKLNSEVEIPDAFYKIIVDEVNAEPRMLGFIIPQNVKGNEPLETFLVSVDEIERQSGMDFFWKLKDEFENKIEKQIPKKLW